MLKEHREELEVLEHELQVLPLSKYAVACLEGRISDLDNMIAQDEYWEKKENV